ncbi:PH domain-containing protein [Alicyclobacillus sp. ALC3]|uniref:PH domain-containing protein n=1 Tax=Alicyclobacillus sp. ALC3 TaxID=2796143 RepID=UPI002378D87D|nr:PH domain-containing protein [Alicyclobacillus sp. ALC3]WDL99309.1 PH domain-containing protein [Alicyclobacillus sp. ALC3]
MGVSKEEIERQLAELGKFDRWFTKKEIKYLPEVIEPGEKIHAVTSGMHDNSTWLIVATQRRILFLDKGMMGGLKQLSISLDKISGVRHQAGWIQGKIEIDASGVAKKIENISKEDVVRVANVVSRLLAERESKNEVAASTERDDSVSKLERLAKLKAQGVLTDEEFAEEKKKVLRGM